MKFTSPEAVLASVFGHTAFRPGQHDVIEALLGGRDAMAVMPTGGGKSLCYQIPALLLPRTTLVISPLVALMKDQVDRLNARGIAAEALHAGLASGMVNDILARAGRNELRLLYIAPERLEGARFRALLQGIPVSLLAVDEAHCISEWGHDFRPAYRSIADVRTIHPSVPVLAVTATATPEVRDDIVRVLALRDPVVVVRGFDRPNLTLRVEPTTAKSTWLAAAVDAAPADPMLIYAGSRKRVDSTAAALRHHGIEVAAYHAGMCDADRSAAQDAFLSGAVPALVATSAFGMGVDKADIRHVVHTDLTLTLEAYYQEAGRAGRDGDPALCTMLYAADDRRLMQFFLDCTYPDAELVDLVYHYCFDRSGAGVGAGQGTMVMADSASIGASIGRPVALVDGALAVLEREGVLERVPEHGRTTAVLLADGARVADFARRAPLGMQAALEVLGRSAAGASAGSVVDCDLAELRRRHGLTAQEVVTCLLALQQARLVRYTPPRSGGAITLLVPRVKRAPVDHQAVTARRSLAIGRLDAVEAYATTAECKRTVILRYFRDGDEHRPCGRCSSCRPSTVRHVVAEHLVLGVVRVVHCLGGRFGRAVVFDVASGVLSDKVRRYGLDAAASFGSMASVPRDGIAEALDDALRRAYVTQTSDQYGLLGATDVGRTAAMPLPPPVTVRWPERKQAAAGLVQALVEARTTWAAEAGTSPSALASLTELEALAADAPTTATELQSGRHGSAAFLARFGTAAIAVVEAWKHGQPNGVPKIALDPPTMAILRAVRPGWTLAQIAKASRTSVGDVANAIQRAVSTGMPLERTSLVPDDVYTVVLDVVRQRRTASVRHLVVATEGEYDPAMLRIALAFARRDLYNAS